ncbi:LPO_1073/Vpar_1526 family protein [Arthrobacter sp. SLBN-53]|uniref:LPO_1073/Vpar_1526 family protein n=1 Tax=Arthrobacter sp. SLBN-53 TaxID=2768412 RepID=UPI001153A2A6|nr:LPO_1073/Vpar_1526 family protein [Arthrobacter sp. SLBN-53]TQK27966.1 hypothetical protein FBY28_0931 [Arthrobacter sp. SLBN-53]
MTAGDEATQIYTDSGVVNIGTQISVGEVLEIGRAAAKAVLMESWPVAEKLIDQRMQLVLDSVVQKMRAKDDRLLERFKDPRFLAALSSAEKSFAESGDSQLCEILTGLLTDLAYNDIRSRREIILRESIECAPRLTSRHLNALSVIFRTTKMPYRFSANVAGLLARLNEDFAPYFNDIPTDPIDYSYMGATGAGIYMPATSRSIASIIYDAHRGAMHQPFTLSDLEHVFPATYHQFLDKRTKNRRVEYEDRRLEYALELVEEVPDKPTPSAREQVPLRLKWEVSSRLLSNVEKIVLNLSPLERKMRDFIMSRTLPEDSFTVKIRDEQPDLWSFFELLQKTSALNFQPSPVGYMLARYEMASRSPEIAAHIDTLFED